MSTRNKLWRPNTLIIILTRNRPRTLRRCVETALKSSGCADAFIILDDSTEQHRRRNRAVLLELLRTQTFVHLAVRDCIKAITNYLPASALEWSKRTARRDIAPMRNISLILSQCFQAEHILLVDDDITEFDIAITRDWVKDLAEEYGSVVVGAHIGGVDETDTISRLESAIQRACTCTRNGGQRISARESFTVIPKWTEDVSRSEFVSGGYLSFKFGASVLELEPFPPGYNEDWLWCLSLQQKGKASVFRIPQVIKHDPMVIRSPNEDDVFFELRGDVALENEMAGQVLIREQEISAPSAEAACTQEFDNHGPDRRTEKLLMQIQLHEEQCRTYLFDQFRPFGLEVIKRLQADLRLRLDWSNELHQWKLQSIRNRDSFFEAMHSRVTDKLSELIEKGRL
jgi:hypothetical protein